MLRDAEFFNSRIGKLDGAADVGDYLVRIVKDKAVAEKSGAPEANLTKTETASDNAETNGQAT